MTSFVDKELINKMLESEANPLMTIEPSLRDVLPALTAPFPSSMIKWKQQRKSSKNPDKAQFVPYLDARDIQRRLDDVVPGEWSFHPDVRPLSQGDRVLGHYCVGTLTIRGVSRSDVGSSLQTVSLEREQKILDNIVDPKTSVSDSMKRVAALFGIGRYLWSFDRAVWVEHDGYGKPKEAIPQSHLDYAYKLGLANQIFPTDPNRTSTLGAGALDVLRLFLEKIEGGDAKASDLLDYVGEHGIDGLAKIITSYFPEDIK